MKNNLCSTCALIDERYKGTCPLTYAQRATITDYCWYYEDADPPSEKVCRLNSMLDLVRKDDGNLVFWVKDIESGRSVAQSLVTPDTLRDAVKKLCPKADTELHETIKFHPLPRAHTKPEARDKFLRTIKGIAEYWSQQKHRTDSEICHGVAFSILNLIDGDNADMPSMDLVLHPHESDQTFHERRGENWFEDGMIINDNCDLHELYSQREKD